MKLLIYHDNIMNITLPLTNILLFTALAPQWLLDALNNSQAPQQLWSYVAYEHILNGYQARKIATDIYRFLLHKIWLWSHSNQTKTLEWRCFSANSIDKSTAGLQETVT